MDTVLTQNIAEVTTNKEPITPEQSPTQLVESLLALPDFPTQQQFLTTHILNKKTSEQGEIAELLKSKTYDLMRADYEQCTNVIALIFYLANLTQHSIHRAIGLLAKANYLAIGQTEYEQAVELYNEAATIYRNEQLAVKEAQSQIGKIFALSMLGKNDEAFAVGEFARQILFEHEEWFLLANLIMNLAIVRQRLSQDQAALILLEEARDYYEQLGEKESRHFSD